MKNLFPAMLMLLCLASGAVAQSAPDAEGWGEPVGGVQLHLALVTTAPPAPPDELPRMELQLRNRGPATITVRPEDLLYAHIEVDDIWYAQPYATTGSARPVDIAPGAQSTVYRRERTGALMFSIGANQGLRFELLPGRHRIRVGINKGAITNLRGGGGNELEFVASNRITVDIPEWSASAERGALIAQTSAGGFDYLSAAQRLVGKYPDAALSAIEAGMAATTNPDARARYVELAGTIAGDGAIPFLLTQTVPAVELRSRMGAADALLAHGRDEGLWSLMETWQHIDRIRPNYTEQAQLLGYLVRTGKPQVFDLLGGMAETTADTRLAIVELLLPIQFNSKSSLDSQGGWRGSALSMGVFGSTTAGLPGGVAGAAAAERFLGGALDDCAAVPIEMRSEGTTYTRPRVCDMAALALSLRWPAKYQFAWSTRAADRDRQIAVVKAAWKAQP